MTDDLPISNIKDFIVKCRKQGHSDSEILEQLNNAKWPSDIVEKALKEADDLEPRIEVQNSSESLTDEKNREEKTIENEKVKAASAENISTDKAKDEKLAADDNNTSEKKKFSFLGVIALLFSLIPFLGLSIGVTAWNSIRKNNKSGGIFALIAILINFCIILVIFYVIYQIFTTINSDNLTGISKYINERFNLI